MSELARHLAHQQRFAVTVVCSHTDSAAEDVYPFRVIRLSPTTSAARRLRNAALVAGALASHRRVLVNGLESLVQPIARAIRRQYVLKVVGDGVWQGARNTGRTTQDIDEFQTTVTRDRAFASALRKRARVLAQASVVVTPSCYLRDMVSGWGVDPGLIKVIPNGVTKPDHLLPAERAPGEGLRLLFVGRLTNWKGVDTVLLALPGLDGVDVTIAGDGPERPALETLARQLGVERRVRFAGRLTATDVGQEMRTAHALVLTSLYEGLSHTLLEAQAHGLPCIASDRGGNREALAADAGFLIEPLDPTALRDAIVKLRDDEELRRRMSRCALDSAERFSMVRAADAYSALLAS